MDEIKNTITDIDVLLSKLHEAHGLALTCITNNPNPPDWLTKFYFSTSLPPIEVADKTKDGIELVSWHDTVKQEEPIPVDMFDEEPVEEISLSPCQTKALELLKTTPDNVFITGGAGVGKTFLTNKFLKEVNLPPSRIKVIAPTGVAAILADGATIHSFLSLPPLSEKEYKTFKYNKSTKDFVRTRLQKVKLLVIEEISMVSGSFLAFIEKLIRRTLKSKELWGGIRVVVSGDFGQIPPVEKTGKIDWAFKSDIWKKSKFQVCCLKTPMRTKDENFLKILNYVRQGECNKEVENFLNSRLIKQSKAKKMLATRIFPRNIQVNNLNYEKLRDLPTEEFLLKASCTGNERLIKNFFKNSPILQEMPLREGAFVMVRINTKYDGIRVVNGTQGVVTKIDNQGNRITIKLTKQDEEITIARHNFELYFSSSNKSERAPDAIVRQYPITLAWAATSHRMQGTTLDEAIVDLSNLFVYGQAYVIMSRCKTAESLHVLDWDDTSIEKTSKVVKKFYEKL